jgi:hypothetical protein
MMGSLAAEDTPVPGSKGIATGVVGQDSLSLLATAGHKPAAEV